MSIEKIEKIDPSAYYYNLKDKLFNYIIKRSEMCFSKADVERQQVKTKDELRCYTDKMRKKFIEAMGGIPYDASLPLNAKTTGVIEDENFHIEKVVFESRPNVYVTANLYLPKKRKEKCGAVLFQCGHSVEGKSYAQYQRVARSIASAGLIVLIYDPVGQGERWSYSEKELENPMVPATVPDHDYFASQCFLLGDSPARYFLADAMRGVDYLQSRPEVDSTKIGATGSSGGGLMTTYMMVCDERIKAAAPGTFVMNRREYLYSGGAQDSEQIWLGATDYGFDHNELLMCYAPKPLLILAASFDFFPIEGTKNVYDNCKYCWELYGKDDKLKMYVDKSQHSFTDVLAAKAATFFAEELNNEHREADKESLCSLDVDKLRCTKTGQIAFDYPDSKFIYNENLERYQEIKKSRMVSDEEARRFLTEEINRNRDCVEPNVREFTTLYENGLKIQSLMWFSQKQMPNFGILFCDFKKKDEKLPVKICLWDKGTDDIEGNIYKIREICGNGYAAFVVDLAGMGKCKPHDLNYSYGLKENYGALDLIAKDLFFLNDSLAALRLFELTKTIEMLQTLPNVGEISIYTRGISKVYAELYKILNENINIESEIDYNILENIVTSKYYENYNIASIIFPKLLKYLDI